MAPAALPICWRAPRADFTPVDTAADDPAMMIYTSGTTGQPKGALHAHRVLLGHLSRHRAAAFSIPASRRPLLDARRLGLGRRPARRAAAEPALRRAGGGAQFDKFDPDEAFALMAQTQRAQRVHSADRAAHDAGGAEPARALRFQAAQRRLRRRVARRRGAGMGQVGVRPRRSTSSTARPNAIWCSAPARSSACSRPAPSASRSPATAWR